MWSEVEGEEECHEWVDGWCGGCGMLNVGSLKEMIAEVDEKVRQVWPPLEEWMAKVRGTMTALGIALTGLM